MDGLETVIGSDALIETIIRESVAHALTVPPEIAWNLLELELSEGMRLVADTEMSKSIMCDNTLVGGILLLDLDEDEVSDPFSDELLTYLQNNVMKNINSSDFDYMRSSSLYAYVQVLFDNPEYEYIHYIIRGDSACYDLWFDRNLVDSKTEKEIIQSVRPNKNIKDVSSDDTLTYATKEFTFYLPDDFERDKITDSSCLITSKGLPVGGYTTVNFRKGVLTDPVANEVEIVETLINSVENIVDLSVFDSTILQEGLIKVCFCHAEMKYEHYILYFSQVDTYYVLWFDSNRIDNDVITEIVYSASVKLQ